MVRRLARALAVAAACGAMVGFVAAAGPSLRPLHRKMNAMRSQITNLSARFANGVVGGIRQEGDAGSVATPGRTCCASNLDRIDAHIAAVSILLGELDETYADEGNRVGLKAVKELRIDLDAVASAIDTFATAPEHDDAEDAVGNLHRTYLHMRSTHEELLACCALAGDLDPEPVAAAETKAPPAEPAKKPRRGKKD